MEPAIIQEYKDTRIELSELQRCITEYIKLFYGSSAAIVGAYALFGVRIGGEGFPDLPLIVVSSIPLILAIIVLSFATVLFHKFNSHNRYAGYARALAQENWENDSDKKETHLWEVLIGYIYSDVKDFHRIDFSNDDTCNLVLTRIKYLKLNCENPFNKFIEWRNPSEECSWERVGTIRKCFRGFRMIARATIFRENTKSWTYPFQVAFPPFSITVLLLVLWLSTFFIWVTHEHVFSRLSGGLIVAIFQICATLQIIISWFGLAYRLYRLCDDNGDRTIDAYCQKFMRARFLALKSRKISVTYTSPHPYWDLRS